MSLDPAVIALVGTLFGGIGLKLVETWLGRKRIKIDDAGNIRNELRLEIAALRIENSDHEKDVDVWREKYYRTYEKLINARAQLMLHGLSPPEDDDE